MSDFLYRHFDKDSTLLYVGVSLSAVHRLSQHKTHSGWFENISRVEIEKHDSRELSIVAETEAIIREKPLHNIMKKNQKIPAVKQIKEVVKSLDRLFERVVEFKPIYSVRDVADFFKVGPSQVENWIAEKKLSYIEIDGRRCGRWPIKKHKKITGWQLISFIEYLDRKNKS